MKLTYNAKVLLETRYFQPGETWPKLARRVAKSVARVEADEKLRKNWADQFVSIIETGEFVPATPFLMNAGISDQYFSCYVLPIDDSLDGIYITLSDASKIFQMAGGCGYDFSTLRPKGSPTSKNPNGMASGPVSFMKVYDASCNQITQGGCVVEGTRVTLANGSSVKIETLCPTENMISPNTNIPLNISVIDDTVNPHTTATFFNNGISDTIKIRTTKGFTFEATPTHKVRVINIDGDYVWKELKDITTEDWVALRGNTSKANGVVQLPSIDEYKSGHGNENICTAPICWTADLAQFLGFWFGDGFYTDSGIGFSVGNEEIYDKYSALGYKLFGLTSRRGESREGDSSWFMYFHSHPLLKWLKQGLKLSHEEIPEVIQSSGNHVIQNAFIRGWFDADGAISKDGYPSLSSCRFNVIHDVQKILLASSGILSTTSERVRSNSFTDGVQYSLVISGDKSRRLYYDYIGFTRHDLKNRFDYTNKHHNLTDIYPNQETKIKEWLTDPIEVGTRISNGRNGNKMSKSMYKQFERFIHRGINLSRSRAETLIAQYPKELQDTWIQKWVEGNLYFDSVSEITAGKAQTYDIEVPETRAYIADGWVSHNSRKGAQMGVMRITHPDIEEFIDSKLDLSQLTQFNISCAVTDVFMDAVKNDTDIFLSFPTHPDKDRKIKARTLWKKIIHNAWRTGDPGLIFIDEVNRKDTMGGISATNPCWAKGSLISTSNGLIPIEEIKVGDTVYVGEGKFETIEKVFNNGEQDILRILTNKGYENYITPDHKVCTNRGLICAKDLQIGDEIDLQKEGTLLPGGDRDAGRLAGMICGDGSFSSKRLQLTFGIHHKDIADNIFIPIAQKLFNTKAKSFVRTQRSKNEIYRWNCGTDQGLIFARKYSTKEFISRNTLKEGSEFIRGFVEGLFFADGHVETGHGIIAPAVASIHEQFIKDLQILLLQFGIQSTIYNHVRPGHKTDKKYGFKSGGVCYRLQITGESRDKFCKEFELLSPESSSKIQLQRQGYKDKPISVISIESAGKAIVYDFTTDGDKLVFVNGIKSLDCSEQPLPPYGCCDLGSIDVSKLITKKGEFDFDRYNEIIQIAVRFLDDAIDGNNYTLESIKKQSLYERRIGLGIMGFADALIELGMSYDSDEARHWAESIVKVLEDTSKKASEELAIEKGSFPGQSNSKLKNDPPIRNCMRTTIAPTGSISIIAGCSSGIEPIYAIVFERQHNLADHPELMDINAAFQRIAIERNFYSDSLMKKIFENHGSCQGLPEVPDDVQRIFKTAADLYPADHVRMLSTWQQFIQSGVSKTINLAETATEEDIEKVYWQAFESKCKGITVFRDKCRGGKQVLNTGSAETLGRPDIIPGKTMKVSTALGKMYITVNETPEAPGKPFEVFVMLSKGGTNASADAEAIGRLVSLALRNKVQVDEIIKHLKGIGAGEVAFNRGRVVSSIPDAVAYVLERMFLGKDEKIVHPDDKAKYFPSGTQVQSCKDCG